MGGRSWGKRGRLARGVAVLACAFGVSCIVVTVARAADKEELSHRPREVVWVLEEGYTTITLDRDALSARDLNIARLRADGSRAADKRTASLKWQTLTLRAIAGSELRVDVGEGSFDLTAVTIQHEDGLALASPVFSGSFGHLEIADDAALGWGDLTVRSDKRRDQPAFLVRGALLNVDRPTGTVTIWSDELHLSREIREALGLTGSSDDPVGSISFEGRFVAVDNERQVSERDLLGASSLGSVSSGSIGPDVIVLSLPSVNSYGSLFDGATGERISAYAVGTTSCNIGDQPAVWIDDTNEHPVIGQNLYRHYDGRFEHIGMSWLKHGFFAVRGTQCGDCIDPGGISGQHLGVNCSDPYSANLNGAQNNLGPKSPVNAFTGFFPYPFNRLHESNVIDRRLQVKSSDLEPALGGADYFVEGHYVTPDDALAGNGTNNVSYRSVSFIRPNPEQFACRFLDPDNDFCAIVMSNTRTQMPAIKAWKLADPSVVESDVFVPGGGIFQLSVKVTDLETGFWRYEYALYNMNSHRSARSFRIALPVGAVVQNPGFHAPFSHSGEPYSNDPWTVTVDVDTNSITWATTPFDVDPNANALRWSTLYNFRFDTNASPQSTSATIGLFRPGAPATVTTDTVGPSPDFIDCNANSMIDACDISCEAPGGCQAPCGFSDDCNGNAIPDECEPDCNENGIADECDLSAGTSDDCDGNLVPDECDPDCDDDGTPDACEAVLDADGDGVDDCDDLCPETTPEDFCLCPELDRCCFNTGLCVDNFLRDACLEFGGTPDCTTSPCRGGCLVGDWDVDGDLDLGDTSNLLVCFSGFGATSGFVRPSDECLLRFDFDNDGDVDRDDYVRFFDDYTGP